MTDEERDDDVPEEQLEWLRREVESAFQSWQQSEVAGPPSSPRAVRLEQVRGWVRAVGRPGQSSARPARREREREALKLLDEALYNVSYIQETARQVCESIESAMHLLGEAGEK